MLRLTTGPTEDARQVSFPIRSFVRWPPRPSPGDSQSVLSLVTFFGLAKKVTRRPAGTGEVKVFNLTLGKIKNRRDAPRQAPYFLSKPTKSRQKMAVPAGSRSLADREGQPPPGRKAPPAAVPGLPLCRRGRWSRQQFRFLANGQPDFSGERQNPILRRPRNRTSDFGSRGQGFLQKQRRAAAVRPEPAKLRSGAKIPVVFSPPLR